MMSLLTGAPHSAAELARALGASQALQQHVPADRLARVYSYDAVGSFVAIPVGEVAVGPLAGLVGLRSTLLGCAGAICLATALALSTASVRDLQRRPTSD